MILLTLLLIWTAGLFGCSSQPEALVENKLLVHFLDVGQGDCVLIESEGHFMLVDAGKNEDAKKITGYLRERKVKKLDYLIGTHPHEDHIGSMDDVVNSFEIGIIIMPEQVHTTKSFQDVLDAIEEGGYGITLPKPGDTYPLGEASFQILAPVKENYENLNDWSVGIRLMFGDTSFIMCGDAEKAAESHMVSNGIPLKAHVLKASHHGSDTSSSPEFLEAVNPSAVVISVGEGNDYGHPADSVLERYKGLGAEIYRTDQQGTIIAESDGKKITFSCRPQTAGKIEEKSWQDQEGEDVKKEAGTGEGTEYIRNINTKKFHVPTCESVSKMKEKNKEYFSGKRSQLLEEGYEPCGNCRP